MRKLGIYTFPMPLGLKRNDADPLASKCIRCDTCDAYWWFFWVFLWIVFSSLMLPIGLSTYRLIQSLLQLLQRRYANGDITDEEYEERRAKLLRDVNLR